MTIRMNLGEESYDIVVSRGALSRVGEELDLNRRVLVVTDTGVPKKYADAVLGQCKDGVLCVVEEGENSKSLSVFERLLGVLLTNGFSRNDCVLAVGGGVVGDLAGFAASAYMRGIDFYNVPTTLLAQIDSSIGGKCAVNFGGVKNVVGAFYQPKKVLIDPDVLQTLPQRQIANGLAEAIKMALTSDGELFELFEREDALARLDEIIVRALQIKKNVVEKDEKESHLRRVLNFGHTIGHGIEVSTSPALYHGECVSLGMLPLCGDSVRPRLEQVLKKYGLCRKWTPDWDKIAEAIFHDKKADGALVTVIAVEKVGSFSFEQKTCEQLLLAAKSCLKG